MYNGVDVGFIATPRLGVDILVGRSGLLHASVLLSLATVPFAGPRVEPDEGVDERLAIQLGYAVMF